MTTDESKRENCPEGDRPEELDPDKCELDGISIVEAGAGTGKTYTIQKLVLRLLLEKEVRLPKILVVTFTEFATGELLDRLHTILQQTKEVLELEGLSADAIYADGQYSQISKILKNRQIENLANRKRCLGLIRGALQDYDQAAVMTIHGFCQRMLMDNAMQSFMRYGAELRADYSDLERKIAMDFCRKIIYSRDFPEVGFDLAPEELLKRMGCALKNAFNDTEIKFADVGTIDEDTRNELIRKIKDPAFWEPLRNIDNDLLVQPGKEFLKAHLVSSFSELVEKRIEAVIAEEEKTGEDRTAYLFHVAQKLSKNSLSEYLNLRRNASKELLTDAAFVPFFETVDGILKLAAAAETAIGKAFLKFYKEELEKYKAKEGFLTFEDQIGQMAELVTSPEGKSLCENIRNAYSYVFIDEFQDTDPCQYKIFSTIFGNGKDHSSGIFMIGDPKQAIYSFRGGDVYAYLDAIHGKHPEYRHFYTLVHNYRSGEEYINALNAFYGAQEDPFNNGGIKFAPIEKGETVKSNLLPEKNPLQFCEFENNAAVIDWTVKKVLDLLSPDRYFIGGKDGKKPVSADDIAILFPTKSFGGDLEKALNAENIDTIWMSESDIFQLPEAMVVWRFLQMLYDGVRFRDMIAVLSDGLFMLTATEIRRVQKDTDADADADADAEDHPAVLAQKYFLDLRKTWENKGIHAMFRELLNVPNRRRRWIQKIRDEGENGIPDRFEDEATLAVHIFRSDEVDGPYILGHIRQLVDKLHKAARERHLTPGGLLVYLRAMINQEKNQEDSGLAKHVQRNTDSPAVRLMTLHSSKGLEFPIVLLPNVPTHKNNKVVDRLYHDPGNKNKRMADMTGWLSNAKLENNEKPGSEFLEEKLRLLYVGLTRAKYACYVPYSPKAYDGVTKKLSSVLAAFPAAEIKTPSYVPPVRNEAVADSRVFGGDPVFDWPVGSFSSFNSGFHLDPDAAADAAGVPPSDESGGDDERGEDELPDSGSETAGEKKAEGDPAALPGDEEQNAIFSFAGGKNAGTIWHEIFELMEFHPEGLSDGADFSPEDMMLLEKLPKRSLYTAIRKLKDDDKEVVKRDRAFARMLKGILCNPLTGNAETLFLKDISPQQCARELRFLYVLKSSVTLRKIKDCLEKYHIPTGSWADNAKAEYFDLPLTGSLDLLCQSSSDKYYVIDWKTNQLTGKMTAFSADGVRQEVITKMYSLQYLIYTVALWHFIRERLDKELTRENYSRYFGGIFYLFVRGMAAPLPEMTPEQKETCRERGIFYTLPPYELIEEFKDLLDIRSQTTGTERN